MIASGAGKETRRRRRAEIDQGSNRRIRDERITGLLFAPEKGAVVALVDSHILEPSDQGLDLVGFRRSRCGSRTSVEIEQHGGRRHEHLRQRNALSVSDVEDSSDPPRVVTRADVSPLVEIDLHTRGEGIDPLERHSEKQRVDPRR
ncbi:MAG: hypothetical protein J0L92_05200 [Deltaproteobacteria bacterium]|nr:hypothetical protein [Deltaproteobacteria bacterium]